MADRQLNAYEKTHLARHGYDPLAVSSIGTAPVEYVTGTVEFCGLEFAVNRDVLIPRIETEHLVDMVTSAAIDRFIQEKKPVVIADVGTGSGAILITVCLRLIEKKIPFIGLANDVSQQAVIMAQQNAHRILRNVHIELIESAEQIERNTVKENTIYFFKSSILDLYPKWSIDVMVANLPYIPEQRIAYLDESVKDHEPHVALDGGEDGFMLVRKLLATAPQFLTKKSVVLLEIDHTHTAELFEPYEKEWQVKMLFDEEQRQRYAELQLK